MHLFFYLIFILLTTLNSTASCMRRTSEDTRVSAVQSLIDSCIQNGAIATLHQRDATGDTLLMRAASSGTLDDVNILLAFGADINAEDRKLGAQPLWLAVAGDNTPEVIEALLKARPHNINHIPMQKPDAAYWDTHDPYCALSAAVLDKNYKLVSLLIQYGASIDTPEPHYKTPLKRAIMALNLAMVHHLLEQGKRQIDADRDILARMIIYVKSQFSVSTLSPDVHNTLSLILHKLYTV